MGVKNRLPLFPLLYATLLEAWGAMAPGREMDEKDVATQPQETGQNPRLSGQDEDPGRPEGAEAPPSEGALAPHARRSEAVGPKPPAPGGKLLSLKGDRAFQRLRKGRAGRGRYVSVKWLPAAELRVGIVVSKKVGKAVVRNKVKRRLREILRRLHLPQAHLLVVASPEAREADFAELFRDVVRALRKSGLVQ
ncbi:ribonuclease P protein subunit [Thermus thermophilus HB27]|nr:ribonuclease P protein subunit [Thermus thermophilus HB27]